MNNSDLMSKVQTIYWALNYKISIEFLLGKLEADQDAIGVLDNLISYLNQAVAKLEKLKASKSDN